MEVTGLTTFRDWFAEHQDKYVLIGGCAAYTTLDQAGLKARSTKDLDVVLVVEALNVEFANRFWEFIAAGGFEIRQRGEERTPTFYRFEKPGDSSFPKMIELFARTPDLIEPLAEKSHLTPLPIDQTVSSLSAILLDDHYYRFILDGRREQTGLRYIGEDRLIPLKARAWLDLRQRRSNGDNVDQKDVRKHLGDVLNLAGLLQPGQQIPLPEPIFKDLQQFLGEAAGDETELRGPGRQKSLDLLARVAQAYQVEPPATSS